LTARPAASKLIDVERLEKVIAPTSRTAIPLPLGGAVLGVSIYLCAGVACGALALGCYESGSPPTDAEADVDSDDGTSSSDGADDGGGRCSGTPVPCSSPSVQTYTGCHSQSGCSWSEGDLTCRGIPIPCATVVFEAECRGMLGCIWG
jgi:hypothetical protein